MVDTNDGLDSSSWVRPKGTKAIPTLLTLAFIIFKKFESNHGLAKCVIENYEKGVLLPWSSFSEGPRSQSLKIPPVLVCRFTLNLLNGCSNFFLATAYHENVGIFTSKLTTYGKTNTSVATRN